MIIPAILAFCLYFEFGQKIKIPIQTTNHKKGDKKTNSNFDKMKNI